MNFFEHQDQARQKTKQLLALFAASVLTLVLGVYFVAIVTLGKAAPSLLLGGCVATNSTDIPPIEIGTNSLESTDLLAWNSPQVSRDAAPSLFSYKSGSYNDLAYNNRRRRSSRRGNSLCHVTTWFQPHIFLGVAAVTLGVILGASAFKIAQLRSGGHVIAEELGGRLVTSDAQDDQERMLLNVVEEMAIASGIAVPQVYLMDNEAGINAFAAGFSPNEAVIGVTRGCLEQLNRDELQGVIGHEFSHILNGDMRMNIQLMGWLHGILCIYLIGRGIADIGRYSNDREGNSFGLFGIGLIVLGGSGLFFGRLMQSAISRQREFLADASAVQFTRNPDGIASALEKIGGVGSKIEASYAQASSHMFFGSVLSSWWSGDWFATHPPIRQRVAQIRGVKPDDLAEQASNFAASQNSTNVATNAPAVAGISGFSSSTKVTNNVVANATNQSQAEILIQPDRIINNIGTVAPQQYNQTQKLLAKIPPEIRNALRESESAKIVIYALMLDRENPSTYQQQVNFLNQVETADVVGQACQLQSQLKQLDAKLYMPLVELTIPALRQKSSQDTQRFLNAVHELAKADGQWTLAEFVTYLVLQYRLQPKLQNPTQAPEHKTIAPVWDDCINLIAALAQAGSNDSKKNQTDNINYAFRSGLMRLPGSTTQQTIAETAPAANLGNVRQGLERLRSVTPKLKQSIVDACAHTVMVDQTVTLQEADLLRAIVILLDCPMPPFLNHQ